MNITLNSRNLRELQPQELQPTIQYSVSRQQDVTKRQNKHTKTKPTTKQKTKTKTNTTKISQYMSKSAAREKQCDLKDQG